MSGRACIIDVPATVNRKHVKLRAFETHLDIWFHAQDAHCTIPRENIQCMLYIQELCGLSQKRVKIMSSVNEVPKITDVYPLSASTNFLTLSGN